MNERKSHDPLRWPRIKEVVADALELPPEERASFVRQSCGSDASLRDEVELLLLAHDDAQSFLADGSLPDPAGSGRTEALDGSLFAPGTEIGPYRVLHLLGEGGFGSVYLAEQREPIIRRAALKVIKPGMDSRRIIARFEAECQAIARMSHPGIARVLDAGSTDDGRPYFVMEYVEGVSITEYCERHRLAHRERLGLFVQVCQAVHHAHQKGIIHRDIKPSNVLVAVEDGKPAPKIIDFGIARATERRLTEQSLFTELGQMIGTPEYMSPEQAAGEVLDIDTRSDVYSLGVLLYELLAGALPFDARKLREQGYAELQRVIREVDPPKPSARLSQLRVSESTSSKSGASRGVLASQVRGDLDWVTMKALEKDRSRRYASAAELALDVQRHLEDEPVLAGPPDAGYRLRKFVRKNRAVVSAVVGITLTLLVGLVASLVLYLQVEEALETTSRALDEKDQALGLSEGLRLSLRSGLVLEGDPGHALLLAIESGRRYPGRESNAALINALRSLDELQVLNHEGSVLQAQPGADGRTLVTVSAASAGFQFVKIWDLATGRELSRSIWPGAVSAAFAPEDQRLLLVLKNCSEIYDCDPGHPGACKKSGFPMPGRWPQAVEAAYVSPDARRVALVSRRRGLWLFDRQTARHIATPSEAYGRLSWLPGGRFLFLTDAGEVLTIDSETGSTEAVLKLELADTAPVFSARLDESPGVSYRDIEQTIQLGGLETATAFAARPDGSFAVAYRDAVNRYSGQLEAPTDRFPIIIFTDDGSIVGVVRGHDSAVTAMAFDATAERLVYGAQNGSVYLARAESDRVFVTRMRGHRGPVLSACFLPDGNRVVTTGDDGTARIWDPGVWERRFVLRGFKGEYSWLPDGRQVLLQTSEGPRLWTPDSGSPVRQLRSLDESTDPAQSARFARDGRLLLVTGNRSIAVWNNRDEPELRWRDRLEDDEYLVEASVSPAGDSVLMLISTLVGERRSTVKRQRLEARRADTGAKVSRIDITKALSWVVLSPSGRRVVEIDESGEHGVVIRGGPDTRRIGDLPIYPFGGLDPPPVCGYFPPFTPDGSRIVTIVCEDDEMDEPAGFVVSDSETGEKIAELPAIPGPFPYEATFDPTGRFVAVLRSEDASEDTYTVTVLDLARRKSVGSATIPSEVIGLHFAEDARFLVVATSAGQAIMLPALSRSIEEAPLELGAGGKCVDTDLQEDVLVAAFDDGTVRLWSLERRECTMVLDGHQRGALRARFSPRGDRLLTAAGDGTATVWPLDPLSEAKRLRTRSLTTAERREAGLEP